MQSIMGTGEGKKIILGIRVITKVTWEEVEDMSGNQALVRID